MSFVANFIRFPARKISKNRLRFDKVTESLMVGTFLRHSVHVDNVKTMLTATLCYVTNYTVTHKT